MKLLKILCGILLSLALPARAATTWNVSSSQSEATIQAVSNGASAGDTVKFAAGIYNWSAAFTMRCGVAYTGPVVAYSSTNNQTAIFNMGAQAYATLFNLYPTCTSPTSLEYVWVENWGLFYSGDGTISNLTVEYNANTGLFDDSSNSGADGQAGIDIEGDINSTVTNLAIEYNNIGDSNSCSAIMNLADDYGACVGIQIHVGDLETGTIEHNYIFHTSGGIHVEQLGPSGGVVSIANNMQIRYNYLLNYHRIAVEDQVSTTTVVQQVSDNVAVYPITPFYGTFALSMACCISARSQSVEGPDPSDYVNDNILIVNSPAPAAPFGIEWWGIGTEADNNLIQGNFANAIAVGYVTPDATTVNNYLCGTAIQDGGYYGNEEGTAGGVSSQASTPAQLIYPGNENSAFGIVAGTNNYGPTCAQTASTAPTISPATGSYTSPPTITLSDTGLNTSIYYTVDGSTPVPGSGTTKLYTAPFLITLPATVKTVGMWGSAPQPLSYAAPFGYVPSAVQSAAYSATGGVTLTSVSLTNTGAIHTLAAGASLQMTANCVYSNGATTNCTNSDAYGNSVSNWISGNTAVLGISSGGLMTGVAAGSTNVTAVIAGMTTPAWSMTVTSPLEALKSVSLATTGGISNLAVGAANQMHATCTYSDNSTTNCAVSDVHGNVVNPWASSAPSIATVSSSGVANGVAGGSANLTATVNPSMVVTSWGQTAYNTTGDTYPGYLNSTYFVFGNQAGGYLGTGGTCSFYLPSGTLTVGSLYDCGLILAPTPTTEASSWLCWYTYTVTAASQPGGFVSGTMNNCGNIAAGTAAWVAVTTNQPGESVAGFDNCGGSCNGTAPTVGNGTYPYYCVAQPYGTRTGLPSTMLDCGSSQNLQASQFVTTGQPPLVSNTVTLTVTAAAPTLNSVYLTTPGSVNTITVGGTLQFAANCVYSNGQTTNCSVADVYGNAVTNWTTSNAAVVTIGAVGSANPGLATAIAAGAPTIQANVGSIMTTAFGLTISAPTATLTGVSLTITGGVTGLLVGHTAQLIATCLYSDGSNTNCTTTDSHGNVASAYTSSTPAYATVNSTSGLITGVAPGSTKLTASAGSFASTATPLTVLAVPTGIYVITISGPVTFSGTVSF